MPDTVNQRMFDFQVGQALRMHRVATNEAAKIRKISAKIDAVLREFLLPKDLASFDLNQLQSLRESVSAIVSAIHKNEIAPAIVAYANEVAATASETEVELFRKVL